MNNVRQDFMNLSKVVFPLSSIHIYIFKKLVFVSLHGRELPFSPWAALVWPHIEIGGRIDDPELNNAGVLGSNPTECNETFF